LVLSFSSEVARGLTELMHLGDVALVVVVLFSPLDYGVEADSIDLAASVEFKMADETTET
jgi:hypothetical protein